MKFRHWWTALTAAYSIGLAAWLGPDPWMWWTWLGSLATVVVVTIGVFIVRKQMQTEPPAWDTIIASGTAFASFIILAVQSAVLETRSYENIGLVFWSLGLGMVLVVICFLSAYDRPKQTGIY